MLISEKKLRNIIKQIIAENIDPDSIRDPAPFPGEDIESPKSKRFFGYDITSTSDIVLKRREILSYVDQYKDEFLKAAKGLTLSDDEQSRLDQFGRNCIGFLIGLQKDRARKKDRKYSVTKDVEFLGSTRRFFNDMLSQDLKVNKRKFFDIIINSDIKNELLNLEFKDLPVDLVNYLQRDPEFISLDSHETLGLDKRETKSKAIGILKKRDNLDSVPDNKIRFSDIKHHYNNGDIDKTILAITKRIKHILTAGVGLFAPKRTRIYYDLMDLLGYESYKEVNKWLLENNFDPSLLNKFTNRKGKAYGSNEI